MDTQWLSLSDWSLQWQKQEDAWSFYFLWIHKIMHNPFLRSKNTCPEYNKRFYSGMGHIKYKNISLFISIMHLTEGHFIISKSFKLPRIGTLWLVLSETQSNIATCCCLPWCLSPQHVVDRHVYRSVPKGRLRKPNASTSRGVVDEKSRAAIPSLNPADLVRHPWGTVRLKVMQGWKRYINLHHRPPAMPSPPAGGALSRFSVVTVAQTVSSRPTGQHRSRTASSRSDHPSPYRLSSPWQRQPFLRWHRRITTPVTAPPSIPIHIRSSSSSSHTAAEESLDRNECSTPSVGESPISLT
jgi:hypothetical protein